MYYDELKEKELKELECLKADEAKLKAEIARIRADEDDHYSIAKKSKDEKDHKRHVFFGLCAVWFFVSVLFMQFFDWYTFTIYEEYEYDEQYEVVVDRVDTYVCYTTQYGNKYHAAYCGYLWNSSRETTVYAAKKAGYTKCSKCNPNKRTIYEVTETRTRTVTDSYPIEMPLGIIVFPVGVLLLSVWFHIKYVPLKKSYEKHIAIYKEMWTQRYEIECKHRDIKNRVEEIKDSWGIRY